jgi:hypothetical protein
MKRKSDTGLWDPNCPVFIRLVYGFCLEDLYSDVNNRGLQVNYRELNEFLHEPCKKAIVCFLLIKKYRKSILDNVPKEIIQMIVKKVWQDREVFLPFHFEQHHRFMYGHRDIDTYLGITYDIIPSIFDQPSFVYGGEYCISKAAPPPAAVEIYQKFFPGYIASSIYILDGDIYTSHYVSGDIMYGFFFNISDVDCSLYSCEYVYETLVLDDNIFVIRNIAHNLKSKYRYFAGIVLDSIDGVEQPNDSIENGERCHKKYDLSTLNPIDHLKNEIAAYLINHLKNDNSSHVNSLIDCVEIHPYPILGFIPGMCYCCT